MKKLKIMTVFGTRPEAIKMCPLVLEMRKYPDYIEPIVAVTAQHREMLDQVLELFNIVPDYDLNIMTNGQTLYDVTTRALMGLKDVMESAKPDIVLVHGDTTTTFAGALAAFYAQIPVGHVEAGLRTGNKYSPYPEEMNRKLTGSLADIHFSPTATSKANLLKENVKPETILVTGNTVIDALQTTVRADYKFADDDFNKVLAGGKRLILMTTHRRENLGEPMRHVYRALKSVLEAHADVEAIFPVHKNPKVREIVQEELGHLSQVHLIEPMEYEPFANLMAKVDIVLTEEELLTAFQEMREEEKQLLYGKYQLAAGNLIRLLHIPIQNPVNCMKGVMDKLGIARKYSADAVDLFVAQYGEDPCTAHEIYYGISEILYRLACEGAEGSVMTAMEEKIARALSVSWEDFDVPGAYKW